MVKSWIPQLEFVDSANPEVRYKSHWNYPYELVGGLYRPAVPQNKSKFCFFAGVYCLFVCLFVCFVFLTVSLCFNALSVLKGFGLEYEVRSKVIL